MRRLGRLVASALIRRQWAVVTAAALGATACRDGRPNLVLVTVDTLRADRLACYGGKADVGSSLCALGDHGIRYTWAFSTAAHTVPPVVPILTSREPHERGITQCGHRRHLDPKLEMIAAQLATAGWSTGVFVANPILRRPQATAGSSTSWVDRGFGIYDDKMKRSEAVRTWVHEREAEELTDAALAWVKTAREPWFLWVHYQNPHGPYWPPRADTPRDVPCDAPLPVPANESGGNGIPKYQVLGDVRALATYARRYDDEIRYLDGNLARLVAGVEAIGPAEILLTGDHGEALGKDDYYFVHGHSLGIDQIHVPLFWRPVPGARSRRDHPGEHARRDADTACGCGAPDPSRTRGPRAARFELDRAPRRSSARHLRRAPPARSAALGANGVFNGYEPAEGAAIGVSEQRVQGRLAQLRADDGEEDGGGKGIDDASRKMLRALGYIQ